jgi:hypothetical protein
MGNQDAKDPAETADAGFEIGAPGLDAEQRVAAIRARVAERQRRGDYDDPAVLRAERTNLAHLRSEQDFADFYMACLRDSCLVDINDYEIEERRSRFKRPLLAVKRAIWKSLKFYTYRLWSQQNQVNSLFLSTVEFTQRRDRETIAELTQRVEALERKLAAGTGSADRAASDKP